MAGGQGMSDADRRALASLTQRAQAARAYVQAVQGAEPVDDRLVQIAQGAVRDLEQARHKILDSYPGQHG